jgi:hypothetical protein
MIIASPTGAFLRPLAFIILAADFLPDYWIGHIEEAEENPPKMSEMSNPSTCSLHGSKEFNETEDDDKVFSRYWEKEVDIDKAVGKEPAEGKQ